MLRKPLVRLCLAALLLLTACSSNPPPIAKTGVIEGAVTFRSSLNSTEAILESWSATPFVVGELIVGYSSAISLAEVSGTLSAASGTVQLVRPLAASPGVPLGLYANESLTAEQTLALAAELAQRPGVRYAHPNYLFQPLQVGITPNDPLYQYQWHYPAINLPQAWGVTTGSPSTVVAVIDTGIIYSQTDPARRHPDFRTNVLPGYDFISDVRMSNDGDGRDPDPFDVGDRPGEQSTYHGTHVAGTVGAASNEGVGLAGVDWAAQILPVRVLGVGGGTMADIYEGMLWAAGLDVPGVPRNPTPAKVINMSLGGQGGCLEAVQGAIDAVTALGSIVVVAAGNDGQDAWQYSPASCSNVITVGATDYAGARASYSNHGTRIDVMAPGGDTNADLNGDGYVDGVLSLNFDDQARQPNATFKDGTSMAAPHVAGVVSLMVGLDPNLTFQQVRSILYATARPLSPGACGIADGCGAGLIDAYAALLRVGDTNPDPGPGPGPGPNPNPNPGPGGPQGPMIVAAVQEDANGELVLTGSHDSAGVLAEYSIEAAVGPTLVIAWSDENGNFEIDDGDYVGTYPWVVEVKAGSTRSNVDLRMERITGGVELPYAGALERSIRPSANDRGTDRLPSAE